MPIGAYVVHSISDDEQLTKTILCSSQQLLIMWIILLCPNILQRNSLDIDRYPISLQQRLEHPDNTYKTKIAFIGNTRPILINFFVIFEQYWGIAERFLVLASFCKFEFKEMTSFLCIDIGSESLRKLLF